MGRARGLHHVTAGASADEAVVLLLHPARRLGAEARAGLFVRGGGACHGKGGDPSPRRGRPFPAGPPVGARAERRVAGVLQEPAAAIRQGAAALVARP